MKNFKPILLMLLLGGIQNFLWSQAPANHVLMMIKFGNNVPFQEVDALRRVYKATQLDSTVITNVRLWAISDSIALFYGGLSGVMNNIQTSYNAQGNVQPTMDSLTTIRINTVPSATENCFKPQFKLNCVSNPIYPSKIAIIDTGMDTLVAAQNADLNPYFNRSLSRNFSSIGNSLPDSMDIQDRQGHGTAIGHIIGQVWAKNRVWGIGSGQEIIMLRIFDTAQYASQWGIVKALDYAIQQKVQVVNMSISWQLQKYARVNAGVSILQRIFWQLATNNIIVVAAGGNNSKNIDGQLTTDSIGYMPGNLWANGVPRSNPNNLLTIAATNCRDSLASFSNWGANSIKFAALGVNIRAMGASRQETSWSGSSMSSAIVAGLVAMRVAQVPISSRNMSQTLDLLDDCGSSKPQLMGIVQLGSTLLSELPEIELENLYLTVFPNPSVNDFQIKFELNSDKKIEFCLRDVLGHTVQTKVVQGYVGKNELEWRFSQPLSSGLYVLTLKINQFHINKKIQIF